jgi:PAS domain S-box-containing protein
VLGQAALWGLAFLALEGMPRSHPTLEPTAGPGLRLGFLVLAGASLYLHVRSLGGAAAMPVGSGSLAGSGFLEEQFRITLTSVGDAIIATDPEGRITLMNAAAARLTGWPIEEGRGRPLPEIFRIVHTHSREPCPNPVEKVLRTGRVVGLANHTSLLARDGREYQIADSGAPIRDDEGVIRGVVLVFTDVSEDYRLRAALAASETRMRHALEAAREGYWDADLAAGTLFTSPRLDHLVGRSRDDPPLSPRQWLERVHADDRPGVAASVEELWAGRIESQDLEYRLLLPDGGLRWLHDRARIVSRDLDERVLGVAGMVADISARKAAEAALAEGRQRLEDALIAGRIGIVDTDLRTGRVTLSPDLAALHGRSRLTYSTEESAAFVPAEERALYEPVLRRAIESGGYYELEHRILNERTGQYDWIQTRGRIFRDGAGVPARMLSMVVDITTRKRAEERLKHLNAVLRGIREVNQLIGRARDRDELIRESVRILVEARGFRSAWIALDRGDGRLGPFAAAGFSLPDEELIPYLHDGRQPRILDCAVEDRGVFIAPCPCGTSARLCPPSPPGEKKAEGAIYALPLEFDGARFGFLTVALPAAMAYDEEEHDLFRDLGGDLAFALHSFRLRDEREEAMEELRLARDQAESANRAKDEFLAVMSHEMRTPLNPIVGFTHLLLDEADDPSAREYLQTILASSERLLILIDDILDYTRLSSRSLELNLRRCHLHDLCQQALEDVRSQGAHLSLEFTADPPGLSPVPPETWVHADSQILLRLLDNFLSNACKYTPEGRVCLELGQSEGGDGTTLYTFAVRDTGPGIPRERQEELFLPFVQIDSSYRRRHGGVGLGLAICRRLVDHLGGEIGIESEPGKGSRFWFRVALELSPCEPPPAGATVPEYRRARPLRGRELLVVEDNPQNAEILRLVLEQAGGTVTTASNGLEGVALMEGRSFDLVLMDIALPDIDGHEAARRIRAREGPGAATPIVAISAHVDQADRRLSEEAGMVDHLAKPVRPADLVKRLCEILDPASAS